MSEESKKDYINIPEEFWKQGVFRLPKDSPVKILGMKGYCEVYPEPDRKGNVGFITKCYFPNEELFLRFGYGNNLEAFQGTNVNRELVNNLFDLIEKQTDFEDIAELDI